VTDECGWEGGNWELNELQLVRDVVDYMANSVFHSQTKFNRAMANTQVIRYHWKATARAIPPNIIVFTDETFGYGDDHAMYTIAHEFGHRWDMKTVLSLYSNESRGHYNSLSGDES
jgi:hypothetical protein